MSYRDAFRSDFRHGHLFGKGDFKYVVLDLLKERPSHGYDIIRRLEERFHGRYVPSAGVVYPTLQMLEDLGYVVANQEDGRKVYSITEAGLGFLEEHEQIVEQTRERMRTWWGREARDEVHAMVHDLQHLGHLVRHRTRRIGINTLHRVREVVSRACRDIEAILEEQPESEGRA